MSLDIVIKYRDSTREPYFHPFSFQQVLDECWRPLARRLGLGLPRRVEWLRVTDRREAEQLVAEFMLAGQYLRSGRSGMDADTVAYMVRRVGEVLPAIERAVAEWDQVEALWL